MAEAGDKISIAVTGFGLVSSTGLDGPNACAAVRAGIGRANVMDFYPVRSPEGAVSGLVCSAVPLLTEGFEGEVRLVRLLQGGLEDLTRQCPDGHWKTKRTAFYLSAPGAERPTTGSELVADDYTRQEMIAKARESSGSSGGLPRVQRFLSEAALLAGWQGKPELRWWTGSGNTGVAEAIRQATHDLVAGYYDSAIVGGVDSLIDEPTLTWLEMTGRLKTPALASGLQPGEACGFLLLERAGAAANRGASVLATVQAVCLREEANPLFSGKPSSGVALAAAISAVTTKADAEPPPIWIISDLNGESYRANEWGIVMFRLASVSKAFHQPSVWFPAVNLGDVGAATGAVHLALAIQASRRHYSPNQVALLTAASEEAPRSCLVLRTETYRES